MSPTLNKAIAMGYVCSDYVILGFEVYIQVRKKLIKAKIISLPFIK